MTIANAIKKLSKAGFSVEKTEYNFYSAQKPGATRIIEFRRNGRSEEVSAIHLKRETEKHDSLSDYYPGFFVDSITKAIKAAI